jgi:hypothetical protein
LKLTEITTNIVKNSGIISMLPAEHETMVVPEARQTFFANTGDRLMKKWTVSGVRGVSGVTRRIGSERAGRGRGMIGL